MQSNGDTNSRNRQDKSYMHMEIKSKNFKIIMILHKHCIDFMTYLYLLIHVSWNRYGID